MDCFHCIYDDCIQGNTALLKRYESRQAWRRAYSRRRYSEAREQGLCVSCFKRKATHGTLCDECFLRNKKYRMEADVVKRKEKWTMRGETEAFVGTLISGNFAASTVYNYKSSVEKFFSMFHEVTRENMLAYKSRLLEEYSLATASCKCSAMNSYCDFIGRPECKIPTIFRENSN
ncbi:MAG: hypothetical protein LIO57_04135 [Oscillospiraceae bacterium]|nr:hypothetical protein [Oscillospiraceae bacterium]